MNVKVNWKLFYQLFMIAYISYEIIMLPFSLTAKGLIFVEILMIFISELLRQLFFTHNKDGIANISSICLIMLALGLCMSFVPIYALVVYFIVSSIPIFFIHNQKKKYALLVFHFIIYCAFVFYTLYQNGYFTYHAVLNHSFMYFKNYFEILFIITLIYKLIVKRNRIRKLNKELTVKVNELESYSQVVKELTLAEERNRMAQNLHDMMGHSLIAINMHLDVMDKLLDSDSIKAHKLLKKCQEISKISIHDLRKTVHALKESHLEMSLVHALQQLAENIEIGGKVQIQFDLFDGADDLDLTIKDTLYKICKEAITNGIKHGDSTLFQIRLYGEHHMVHFIIKDNGHGIDTIYPSNGLIGMKQKVQLLHGTLHVQSTHGQGFLLQAALPFIKEEKHDTSHDCG